VRAALGLVKAACKCLKGNVLGDLSWYWKATRHPLMGLVMVVPLLIFYEVGTLAGAGGAEARGLRNGADAWVRDWCEQFGNGGHLIPPLLIVAWLFLAALRRWDSRPERLVSTLLGMVLESLALALTLWLFSRLWPDLLKHYGWELQVKGAGNAENLLQSDPFRAALPLVGAGLYEEFLFRLVSLTVLIGFLGFLGIDTFTGFFMASLLSAWFFAAAHHWGTNAPPYDGRVFSFRFAAGLIFSGVLAWRGFGIAVGGHTLYNLLVGLPGSWNHA